MTKSFPSISAYKGRMAGLVALLAVGLSVTYVNAGLFGSNCKDVPNNLCAQVYDDKDCKGWVLDVPEGEMNFNFWHPVWYWYRNDIESVSVRKGCTFTGFDDTGYKGESATIRASANRDRHVNLDDEDEYEDMDEKIQSLACSCRP